MKVTFKIELEGEIEVDDLLDADLRRAIVESGEWEGATEAEAQADIDKARAAFRELVGSNLIGFFLVELASAAAAETFAGDGGVLDRLGLSERVKGLLRDAFKARAFFPQFDFGDGIKRLNGWHSRN